MAPVHGKIRWAGLLSLRRIRYLVSGFRLMHSAYRSPRDETFDSFLPSVRSGWHLEKVVYGPHRKTFGQPQAALRNLLLRIGS